MFKIIALRLDGIYFNYGEAVKPEITHIQTALQLRPKSSAENIGTAEIAEPKLANPTKQNTDLAQINGISANYLVSRRGQVFDNNKDGEAETKTLKDTLPKFSGFPRTKAIAIAKAQALSGPEPQTVLFGGENIGVAKIAQTYLCFGGHWTTADDLEGDHAYPIAEIKTRFAHYFARLSQKERVNGSFNDGLTNQFKGGSLDDEFINQYGKPNQLSWQAYFYDARNIIGLCSGCNGNKLDRPYRWLLNNKFYGEGFIKAAFPLRDDTIIPRAKNGQGLADAMAYYFLARVNGLAFIGRIDAVLGQITNITSMPLEVLKDFYKNPQFAQAANKLLLQLQAAKPAEK